MEVKVTINPSNLNWSLTITYVMVVVRKYFTVNQLRSLASKLLQEGGKVSKEGGRRRQFRIS